MQVVPQLVRSKLISTLLMRTLSFVYLLSFTLRDLSLVVLREFMRSAVYSETKVLIHVITLSSLLWSFIRHIQIITAWWTLLRTCTDTLLRKFLVQQRFLTMESRWISVSHLKESQWLMLLRSTAVLTGMKLRILRQLVHLLRSITSSSRISIRRVISWISSSRHMLRSILFSLHSLWIIQLRFLHLQRKSLRILNMLRDSSSSWMDGRWLTHTQSLTIQSIREKDLQLRTHLLMQVMRKLTTQMKTSWMLLKLVCRLQVVSDMESTVLLWSWQIARP